MEGSRQNIVHNFIWDVFVSVVFVMAGATVGKWGARRPDYPDPEIKGRPAVENIFFGPSGLSFA